MNTNRTGRLLAILLTLVMAVGLLPMQALAANPADDAVSELNKALGADVFQAGDGALTQGDVAAVLAAAGYDSGDFTPGSDKAVTRGEGCEALAVLFQLPIGDDSAIQYLYEQGIINGLATEDPEEVNLDEGGALLQMQFALVAYRVYNAVGGFPKAPEKENEGGSTTVPGGEGENTTPPDEGKDPVVDPGKEGEGATTPDEGKDPTTNPGEGNEGATTPGGESGSGSFDGLASDWAKEELAKADELGLIPDCLAGQDLTQGITRAEFAAVVVKVYEALSGTAAIPAVNNPFTDCNDVEVLKAYNIGAVNGTSDTTYGPDALLNREQASTMLTRVFKKVSMVGWTLAHDSQFSLSYTKPAPFADDEDISDWARDSVYFMAANAIIKGGDGNCFAPKNVTTEQEAVGYANTTREQALLIAVRMVQNLGE